MNLYWIEQRSTIGCIEYCDDDFNVSEWLCDNDYKRVASSTVLGYMNVGISTLHKYNGRYGNGYVRTVTCYYNCKPSTKYMTIEYWIKDPCFCCEADRKGNRCYGKMFCAQTKNRYNAIINPEWHHVSLKTMENIDIDMLDEKHRNYLEFYNHYKRVKRIASANRNPFKVKGWCKIMIMADERMVSQEAYNMVYKNIISTLISASKV